MNRLAEHSLIELLQRALTNARDRAAQQRDDESTPTSIRIPADVKVFFEALAHELGLSWQQTIVLALKAVAASNANAILGMHRRLLDVIEWHGLDAVDTCELLEPWGFTPDVLAEPSDTIHRFDNGLLDYLTKMFQVPRPYLTNRDGVEQMASGHWYTETYRLAQHIVDARTQGLEPVVLFISDGADRQLAFERGDSVPPVEIGIVLQLSRPIGRSDRRFATYEFWSVDRWNDVKIRVHLKALALFCNELGGFKGYHGLTVTAAGFSGVKTGHIHAARAIRKYNAHQGWNPEDYIVDNDAPGQEREELPLVREAYTRNRLAELVAWDREYGPAARLKHLRLLEDASPVE